MLANSRILYLAWSTISEFNNLEFKVGLLISKSVKTQLALKFFSVFYFLTQQ